MHCDGHIGDLLAVGLLLGQRPNNICGAVNFNPCSSVSYQLAALVNGAVPFWSGTAGFQLMESPKTENGLSSRH